MQREIKYAILQVDRLHCKVWPQRQEVCVGSCTQMFSDQIDSKEQISLCMKWMKMRT